MAKTPIGPPIWIILAPVLSLVGIALLPLVGRTGRRPPDEAWRGIFYINRNDPALFVPKRFGIGYTLNFGNSWSWAVLALILIVVALPFILAGRAVHHLPK